MRSSTRFSYRAPQRRALRAYQGLLVWGQPRLSGRSGRCTLADAAVALHQEVYLGVVHLIESG